MKTAIARGNKSHDVSSDVIGGSIAVAGRTRCRPALFPLVEQGHAATTGLFERMHRVMIYMKRQDDGAGVRRLPDSVPHKQLYGGVVNSQGRGTLKRPDAHGA